jgi:hypothetical protein
MCFGSGITSVAPFYHGKRWFKTGLEFKSISGSHGKPITVVRVLMSCQHSKINVLILTTFEGNPFLAITLKQKANSPLFGGAAERQEFVTMISKH